MKASGKHTIYTIGHSTHRMEEFLAMLRAVDIKNLVDIRRLPGSRKFPQFDKEKLETSLEENGIQYMHLTALGGRRREDKNSKNTGWRNASFRGYADYMETEAFQKGVNELETVAMKAPTAYMCAEAVWWRCHRALVSDYLKAKGWMVRHIMAVDKTEEHPYTSPARIVGDRVFYFDKDLFD